MIFDSIASITSVGEGHVYDIEVEDEHKFYCNGFYVSNSRKGALMISLDIRHKEASNFIHIKNNITAIDKANLSFEIDDDFMRAVETYYKTGEIITLHEHREYSGHVVDYDIVPIDIYKEILELIWQVERRFTVIDVKSLMNLSSKHSVRMVQLLEMINGFGDPVAKRKVYSLSELNLMFGTKYKRIKQFEAEILTPIKSELDINSKLSFVYQIVFIDNPKGRGRPIADKVQIDLVRNTPQGSLF